LIGQHGQWRNLGRLLVADRRYPWFCSHTGACAAVATDDPDRFDFFITVRDDANRSVIGRGALNLKWSGGNVDVQVTVEPTPALQHGELGMFDENGVSYPWVVAADGQLRMYYTGWMPTVMTPFQNHLGLAHQVDGDFARVSRAPILARSDIDPLSIGSCAVLRQADQWHMWYTSFVRWGTQPGEPKHSYVIKHASSPDGIHWQPDGRVCISSAYGWDHSIGRPTVWHDGERYHMWFCYRGDHYRLGYASSIDGVQWQRDDTQVGLQPSGEQWDAKDQCYPFVITARDHLLMLYAGNDYGHGGVGVAIRPLQ
jgi:hypothetical protein